MTAPHLSIVNTRYVDKKTEELLDRHVFEPHAREALREIIVELRKHEAYLNKRIEFDLQQTTLLTVEIQRLKERCLRWAVAFIGTTVAFIMYTRMF